MQLLPLILHIGLLCNSETDKHKSTLTAEYAQSPT